MPSYNTGSARNFLKVALPNSGVTVNSTSGVKATLVQRFLHHDVAVVRIPNLRLDSTSKSLAYGTPFQMEYASPTHKATMLGYVHNAQPWTGPNSSGTTITAVGASMPLKTSNRRLFTQMTATDIAHKIAVENRLAFDGEAHPRVFHQVAQSGESDWQFLVALAKRVGYSVRVEGVTLQFISRKTLSRYYRSIAPVVTASRSDNLQQKGLRDVLSFNPMLSEHAQEGSEYLARHVVEGLDHAGNFTTAQVDGVPTPGRAQGDPAFTRFHSVEIAATQAEARYIAEAQAENNRYPIKAEATFIGNPLLAPNRCVYIKGLNDGLSGYWTLTEVVHVIEPGSSYRTEAILGTEGLGVETFSPGVPTSTQTVMPVGSGLNMPYANARLTQGSYGATLALGTTAYNEGPRWTPA